MKTVADKNVLVSARHTKGVHYIREISLTDQKALYLTCALALAMSLWALAGLLRRQTRRRTLIACLLTSGIVGAVWLMQSLVQKPFPDAIPWSVYMLAGVALFVVLSAVLQCGRRLFLGLLAPLAVMTAAAHANVVYQEYPTVGSLDPVPVAVPMTLGEFHTTTTAPQLGDRKVGAQITLPFKGTISGFPARDAIAYIPPAYWEQPEVKLPVLVLLAGNPGDPNQWFSAGQAAETADAYQAVHQGKSPIVISVDGTGSFLGNPVCVDGPTYRVMTYLSTDVPQLIKATFRVSPNQNTWTLGGLSYGGTCALQVVTNHPEVYGNFLDFSGQAEPSIGTHEDTVKQFFGGDEAAFQAVNPEALLSAEARARTSKYQHIQGRFIAGVDDAESREALTHLHALARKAGIEAMYGTVPGGHTFETWRIALAQVFPWVATRGGLGD